MKRANSYEESDADQLISKVLSMETPLWMRLVQECEEKLKSERADTDSQPDPFEGL